MLHSNFNGTRAVTVDYRGSQRRGCNPAGVATLWRTHHVMHDTELDDSELYIDWLTGIKITFNNWTYVILCVCMPYESHAPEDLFL